MVVSGEVTFPFSLALLLAVLSGELVNSVLCLLLLEKKEE